jgi:GH25 family lysozyme M1 (1,4-beta-N-acetylmuramidase)
MGVDVRRWSVGLAAALVASGLVVSPAVAAADYGQAAETYAGSQIARHEGHEGTPSVRSARAAPRGGGITGHDVSSHQGNVDWPRARAAGARFAYVKATEGTGYVNPRFAQQYNGSYDVGMVRGAYHFARPDVSSGATQANYFVDHGGAWSADGRTLPGALDIEYNPYGETCYGLGPVAMSWWLRDFSDTYLARTGRFPAIYTSTSWWNRCTGSNAGFGPNNPLWVARYGRDAGPLPAGWTHWMIWQFADRGALPGDQDTFEGPQTRLHAFSMRAMV